MNIPGIVLHPHAAAQLDEYLKTPAHAVLLAGPAGSGKTQIAQSLAQQLLGVSSLDNQPYVRIVSPKNGSIAIEQIRELIGFFRLSVPGKSAIKRVAVIEDAETMGTEAQNALLKLLEEPPAGSALILTSSQPKLLLPTIRSRTQLLQLAAPDETALKQHFATLGYDATVVSNTLLRTGSNVAESTELLSGAEAKADDGIQLVKQALSGSSYDRLLLVEGLAKQKGAASNFADTLATVAMASLESAAQKGSASLERWQQVLRASQTAQEAFERSGNAKLVLTELMLAL